MTRTVTNTSNQDDADSRSAYRSAGVNVAAGDALVRTIRTQAQATTRPGVTGAIGGFSGLFDLRAAGYSDPLLVAATDGVGTKLRIAIETKQLETIGIDLVAMCVNDLLCSGAEPLFFLDYYATAQLVPADAEAVLSGIAEGCKQANVALIGGETAEMPGMYQSGDFDLAGFAVGAVNRDAVLPQPLAIGDRLLGLPSSGFHSNGFSLVRRIIAKANLSWSDPAPFGTGMDVGSCLLTPTRIYTAPVLELLKNHSIKALAHITGGGLTGNLARVLGAEQTAEINLSAWSIPECFRWLGDVGQMPSQELLTTFNCGVGLVIVCGKEEQARIAADLTDHNEPFLDLGQIVERHEDPVTFVGTGADHRNGT